jgi:hypothetical protein
MKVEEEDEKCTFMWHTERNFAKCVAKDEVFEERDCFN